MTRCGAWPAVWQPCLLVNSQHFARLTAACSLDLQSLPGDQSWLVENTRQISPIQLKLSSVALEASLQQIVLQKDMRCTLRAMSQTALRESCESQLAQRGQDKQLNRVPVPQNSDCNNHAATNKRHLLMKPVLETSAKPPGPGVSKPKPH